MGKQANLIPLNQRPKEERQRIASEGGKASQKVQKQKRMLSEYLKAAIDSPIRNTDVYNFTAQNFDFKEDDLNYNAGVAAGILQAAIKGNMEAVRLIREMTNDKPIQEEQIKNKVKIPAELIGKAFTEVNFYVSQRKYVDYCLKGGRASTKSSWVGLKVIEEIENNSNWCAVAFRRVQNTLRKSIYSQILWAIAELDKYYPGLKDDYKAFKNPLQILKKSTGQIIDFEGLDDADKIKSIKPPVDKYFAIEIWEEFDQVKGMEEVRKVQQTYMRGGNTYINFFMYNTPASAQHWVNVEELVPKENRYIHKSNPYQVKYTGWLGETFFDEAEHLRKVNKKAWENEYLGEITGTGGKVFENLEIREITNEEIETFGICFQGTDFGWFPDPLCWGRMHYNPNQEILYIFDEIYGCKIKNTVLAKEIKEKGVNAEENICDNAEPKSIEDLRNEGINARGTIKKIKGANLLEYGMKWLQTRVKIIIDPKRCPNTAREFNTYELLKDKNGNFITSYPDQNNHSIDMVRYACLRYILSSLNRA